MPYAEHIQQGISYLLGCQNCDGGISIDCDGNQDSGIWTTAETLDAVLASDCLQFNVSTLDNLILMVGYLLKKFIISESDVSGYWEIADDEGPSTMSTGHCVFALQTFLSKVLSNCDLEEVVIANQRYVIKEIRNKISLCSNMGVNWLTENQQLDGGWSYTVKTEKKPSTVICSFYALKGYLSVGKTPKNDAHIKSACVYMKQEIQKSVIQYGKSGISQIPEILYGYTSLNDVGYFSKSEIEFKNFILKFIRRHWRIIKKTTVIELNSTLQIDEQKHAEYVNNLPYIVLTALITAEEYKFNNEIKTMVEKLINSKTNGTWHIYKNGKKETTWVTAEVVLALSLAQNKYVKYQRNVENKKVKTLKIIISILGVLCSALFVYYIVQMQDTANIAQSLLNILVAFLGVVSSFISIIEVFRK